MTLAVVLRWQRSCFVILTVTGRGSSYSLPPRACTRGSFSTVARKVLLTCNNLSFLLRLLLVCRDGISCVNESFCHIVRTGLA